MAGNERVVRHRFWVRVAARRRQEAPGRLGSSQEKAREPQKRLRNQRFERQLNNS